MAQKRLTTAQLAERLGLSEQRVRELARDGRISHTTRTPGGHYRFSEKSRKLRLLRDLPPISEDPEPLEHRMLEIQYQLGRLQRSLR